MRCVVGIVILVVCLLNIQPWLEVSAQIVQEIRRMPFAGAMNLPLIGWLITAFVVVLADVLGVGIWAIVQQAQIRALLHTLKVRPIKNSEVLKKAMLWRGVSYALEVGVSLLRFPPYEGGVSQFWEDAPDWNPDRLDWWMLVVFLVSIGAVELLVVMFLSDKGDKGAENVRENREKRGGDERAERAERLRERAAEFRANRRRAMGR
jgi:hypothetical protein